MRYQPPRSSIIFWNACWLRLCTSRPALTSISRRIPDGPTIPLMSAWPLMPADTLPMRPPRLTAFASTRLLRQILTSVNLLETSSSTKVVISLDDSTS